MSKFHRGLKAAAVSLSLVLGLGMTSVSAQDEQMSPYVRHVLAQFGVIAEALEPQGYTDYDAIAFDALGNGESTTISYTTSDSDTVYIIGACDSDCTDMDLRATSGGRVIAEDVLDDNIPVLEIPAGAARPLEIEIMMPGCSADPCVYGVVVFRRGQ